MNIEILARIKSAAKVLVVLRLFVRIVAGLFCHRRAVRLDTPRLLGILGLGCGAISYTQLSADQAYASNIFGLLAVVAAVSLPRAKPEVAVYHVSEAVYLYMSNSGSLEILHLLVAATHATQAYRLVPGYRSMLQSAICVLRRSFVYVGVVANSQLVALDSSLIMSNLAAAFLPDKVASPIQFIYSEKAFVLRGVLARHRAEFSLVALGEILLGCADVWKAVAISRLFSLAGQHNSRQELLALVLATFVKLVILHVLSLQYRLAKMRLRGQVEGALYLSLCHALVQAPGSTHTSSSLADAKNNVVSPYAASLFDAIAATTSLTSIAGGLALLSADMGWQALGVVLCVLFFLTLSEWASRKHKMRLAVRQRPKTLHSRIRDILPSLSAFKMFAWEELLFKVRNGDNVDDHASAVLAAAATSLSKLARSMSVFLAAWLSADSSLDSIRAISSLQLTAASCAELVSSVGVIAGIWQLETVLQTKLAVWPRPAPASSAEPTISIQNAAFKRAGQADVALRVDSLSASSDQIIGVSGSVGSGKSTLLLAVARELETVSGTVFVSGTMAFVSQSPWLMSGTIRANILFGRPFNDALYSKTTHVCCLDDDIARMALGDNTLVGDSGAALSGGQRTRVALARAIYSQADIYLLDNVLSTLDQTVRRLVWDRALSNGGMLANKIRLMTLDATGYLRRCDVRVVVDNGCVTVLRDLEILSDSRQMPAVADVADAPTPAIASVRTANGRSQAAVARSLPANTDPKSTQAEALQYFVQVCGVCTLAAAVVVGMVLFAVPTILYQRQVSSAHNPQEPRRDLLIWVAMDVLSVWLALVAKETVYVDLARSWIQPVLLDSLAHAQMAEIWRTGDAQLVSVVRCTERATTLGVHVFVVDSIVAIANLVFVAYSTLRLSYAALAVSVLASVGVVFYRMQKGSSALLPIQRYRRRIQVDMDRTAHDMFSGLQVVRIHGVYRVFEDQLRRLDGWQQAAGALANAVLFTKYLWQHVVDAALSLGLVGVMLMTDVGVWRLTPATVQLYYETTSKLLTLLSQLANIQANASNHALVWQELCDMSSTVPEAPWHIAKDQWAGKDASSHIKFTGCGLRYRQGDQLALRGVSFSISAGERVGIVGRTGSGKSSLVYALLRVVELESGAISLGGMDISKLGLHDLRQSISVVPQTAALLEGTVRSNIDPFEEHTDAEIDVAIEACQLGDIGADKKIESGGRNLSAGQQQLVSICRAVLRRRKILVLDEATANVDEHTQQIISAVIKQEFKHSTVLIIAHRLEATAGCSRILVMDSGRLVEQGSPAVLATRSGHYAKLLRAANSNI